MTFEEWWKTVEHNLPAGSYTGTRKAWDARQEEIDKLKEELEQAYIDLAGEDI